MNTNGLAKHYDRLTAVERLALLVGAVNRGDEVEQARIKNASHRFDVSMADYSPYGNALNKVIPLVFLDLLETAADYRDAFNFWYDAYFGDAADVYLKDEVDDKAITPTMVDKHGWTSVEQLLNDFLAYGFILKTKTDGWRLFCKRLGIDPFGFLRQMPGFARFERELNLAEGTPDQPGMAFVPEGMVRWANYVRPADKPKVTEANLMTAARFADAIDAVFREHAQLCGA